MSDTLDVINFPYTSLQLSTAVNRIPNNYGLLNALGLFPSEGSVSTLVEISIEDGTIRVLAAKERGAPGTANDRGQRKSFWVEIPHFPMLDLITPRDLQNMVEIIGRSKGTRTLDSEVAKRLFSIRQKHSVTLEWVRMGALKGVITDGNGDTLLDLYDFFGVTKKTIDFALGTAGTDIISKCQELRQSMATNLKGETMTRPEVIVDSNFFSKFVQHAKVEKFWVNWQAASELARAKYDPAGGQLGRVFEFQQILFREYYGTAPVGKPPVSTPFVPANYGYAYPAGTQNMFETWNAPAEDVRVVNQPGQDIWISPEILKHGEGIELKSQSNCLAVCKRPEALVECMTSN
ncbi:major capsid protein [Bradyrhizobium tropiciagri]|uniref:major capsid protein n=1 Tax=Bradyrhizobium tropiciagri TaxID=312253 RepID=UPI001BAB7057|nr:major capsid protein [Bradyrhizobium tropiciagri]MBR0871194.1 major capsid protein [Bradyrhizobium tropiciagri]